MNSKRCLINLSELKKSEINTGYSLEGIKYLFDNIDVSLELPFTRSQFIQELPERQKGMSISGYQPKLSLCIKNNTLQVVNNNGTYILKPSPEAYPYLAENEHATMMVMQRLKFNIPPFGLFRFKQENDNPKELVFVVRRYDRLGSDANRLHQEQLDGAMGIHDKYGLSEGKKAISYESAAKYLITNIDNSLKSKRDIFLRIVYAYVLGNNDYHLRNMGIILPNDAPPSVAPIYDFVSVVPYPSAFTEYLALPLLALEEHDAGIAPGLDSEYGEYLGLDFILLAENIGINLKLAQKLIHDVIKSYQLIIDTYNESHMPEEQKKLVLDYVARRINLLKITTL
ncbi:type II toxin-antitoxin system HipA family toxin [Proteus sp. GOKU]|uniref:type II toxin-antitoxin system HipA family toxin n=1 Tax=Proteus TaxID=583 RepID=UPI001892C451|nr:MULTISPECIES: HipA domain-containing protein [Proteus]QPB78627.1 type II toxin-antitoxin system HipA family toxin [Proteus sp. GOKU]QQP24634.1 type II toxin-antitoxin system HipA family toxin [Proteus vulgaris]